MFKYALMAVRAGVVVCACGVTAAGAQAAGARDGNTSSGNTGTRTSTNTTSYTASRTTTYSSESRWAREVYAGREQGPAARNWLFVHPRPDQ